MKNLFFIEEITPEVSIEMAYIPGGNFLMGAPRNEAESFDNERPQHRVKVPEFSMGRYPVTQSQWRTVAELPQFCHELDPDPSFFKGDNLPVECVSWLDAIEFCARLSVHTGGEYRLPTESEWEYACRAGTTTPFYFGKTISSEVANYDGNYIYGRGQTGVYRETTTPVGSLKVANNFGLHDMHGNVWEWCQDHWHGSYEGAPTDGSAWITGGNSEKRLVRGGSWDDDPAVGRSAYRLYLSPDFSDSDLGFRVVL